PRGPARVPAGDHSARGGRGPGPRHEAIAVAAPGETEEQRRRRMAQTKFGVGGDTTRQERLFAGERTLGGGLYVPPSSSQAPRREATPQRLNPPGPRVTEYGRDGAERPAVTTVP